MTETGAKARRFRTLPPTVLSEGAQFSGLVVLPEPARIDGFVTGEVIGEKLVWIGRSARVVARIEAEEVVVEGQVEGAIRARDRVDVTSTARVEGDIQTPRLTLADGSCLRGRCRASDATVPPSSTRDSS